MVTVFALVAAGPVPAGADALPPPWDGWTPLSGKIVSEMSAVSTTTGLDPTVYVFGRGSNNVLYYNRFVGTGWAGWLPLVGAQIGGDPSAVVWNGNRMDVFARGYGADRNVYRWSFNGTSWGSGPQSLGCCIGDGASPAAVVVPSGGLNVFIRGTNNLLYHNRYDGFAWVGWQLVPGPAVTGNPAAIFDGFDIEVFAHTTGAVERHVFRWTGAGPGAWTVQDLGCCIHAAGSPAVAGAFDHLEVVIRGTNNNVYARRLTGGTWTSWQLVAGPADVTADPAPAARGSNIELFVRANTGSTLRSTWQLSAWSTWQDLGGAAADRSPAAVTRQPNGPVFVFVTAQDNTPYARTM